MEPEEKRLLADEYSRDFYTPANHDNARDAGNTPFRCRGIYAPAGKRPAERGLPHDTRYSNPSRCKSRNDGIRHCDPAGEAVLYDCRARFHDFHKRARQYADYSSVQSEQEYRCRCPGRAGHDSEGSAPAPGGYAKPSLVPEGKTGRPAP